MTNKTISCAMRSIDFSALFFDLVFFGSFLFLPEKRKKKKKSISRVLCNATFIVMFRSVGRSTFIPVESMSIHCSCIVLTSWLFAMQQYNNTIFVSWIFSFLSFSFDGILGNCPCDAIARIKPFHFDGQTDYVKEKTGQKLKIFLFSQRAYVNDSMNYCVERAIKQIRGNCIAFKAYENVFDNVSALRTLTMSIFTVHLLPYGWLLCLGKKKRSTSFWWYNWEAQFSLCLTCSPLNQITSNGFFSLYTLLTQEMTYIEKLRRPFHNPKDLFPFNKLYQTLE